jgi:hypothetical protein
VDKETAYRILREVNAQHNPDIVYCQHGAYGVLVGRASHGIGRNGPRGPSIGRHLC